MLGIIIIPGLFGISISTEAHKRRFERSGLLAEIADPYLGVEAPYFLPFVKGPRDEQILNRSRLAMSCDESAIFSNIDMATERLRTRGAEKFAFVACGFGGNVALRYLGVRKPSRFTVVHAWFPHMIFPAVSEKFRTLHSIQPPHLEKVSPLIDMRIYVGDKDRNVEKGNTDLLVARARELPNLKVKIYPGATHAFADKFVQGKSLNLMYWIHPANWRAYRLSWDSVTKDLLARSRSLGKNSFSR